MKDTDNYMQYVCKNPDCERMFLEKDLYRRITPETFRYCEECEKKGFPKIRFDVKKGKPPKNNLRRRLF